MTSCAVTYSSLGNRCDRRRGHAGPCGGNLTPAWLEVLEPTFRLAGREIVTWRPADTVDGAGVELVMRDGRTLRADGAALKMLAAMAWRADR